MKAHIQNTRTQYEFTFINTENEVVFTLWFIQKKPSFNKVYWHIAKNFNAISSACNTKEIELKTRDSGYIVALAGNCKGTMTGKTLLEARGYSN